MTAKADGEHWSIGSLRQVNPVDGTSTLASIRQAARNPVTRKRLLRSSYVTAWSVASKTILKLMRAGVVGAAWAGHPGWSFTGTSRISIVADLPPPPQVNAPVGTATTQYNPASVIGGWKSCT